MEKQAKTGKKEVKTGIQSINKQVTDITIEEKDKAKVIPLEEILVLAKAGMKIGAIAKRYKCSHANISQRLKGFSMDIMQAQADFKDFKADIYDNKQLMALSTVTKKKVKESRLGEVSGFIKVCNDGAVQARGESALHVSIHSIVEDASDALKRLKAGEEGLYE